MVHIHVVMVVGSSHIDVHMGIKTNVWTFGFLLKAIQCAAFVELNSLPFAQMYVIHVQSIKAVMKMNKYGVMPEIPRFNQLTKRKNIHFQVYFAMNQFSVFVVEHSL